MTVTPCYLTILSTLTASMVEELAPMLEALNPDDPDVSEALGNNDVIRFDAVFEGDMPPELLRWLNSNKMPFTWEWEAYGGTGAGCNYFDPDADEIHHIRLHENIAVMSVNEAADPIKVQRLIKIVLDINHKRNDVGIV